MDQIASRSFDGRQGSRAKWPVANSSPHFQLTKYGPDLAGRAVTVATSTDNSCQPCRLPPEPSRAAGGVHGNLPMAWARAARQMMQSHGPASVHWGLARVTERSSPLGDRKSDITASGIWPHSQLRVMRVVLGVSSHVTFGGCGFWVFGPARDKADERLMSARSGRLALVGEVPQAECTNSLIRGGPSWVQARNPGPEVPRRSLPCPRMHFGAGPIGGRSYDRCLSVDNLTLEIHLQNSQPDRIGRPRIEGTRKIFRVACIRGTTAVRSRRVSRHSSQLDAHWPAKRGYLRTGVVQTAAAHSRYRCIRHCRNQFPPTAHPRDHAGDYGATPASACLGDSRRSFAKRWPRFRLTGNLRRATHVEQRSRDCHISSRDFTRRPLSALGNGAVWWSRQPSAADDPTDVKVGSGFQQGRHRSVTDIGACAA